MWLELPFFSYREKKGKKNELLATIKYFTVLSQEVQTSGHTPKKQSAVQLHFLWMQYSYLLPIHQPIRDAECSGTAFKCVQCPFHFRKRHTHQYLDRTVHSKENNVIGPNQGQPIIKPL